MTAVRPHAFELVEAVKLHLSEELMPTLTGYQAYQLRVAVNLLEIIQRDMVRRPDVIAGSNARLAALGHAEDDDLAAAIRDNKVDIDDPALRDHLTSSVREMLAINNPKWLKEPA